MYSVKTASLVLKTSDITTSTDFLFNNTDYYGERGNANKNLSSITWNNINLRQVLGDMYDEFDEFNLVLKQVSTSLCNSRLDGGLPESRAIYFRVSGLPFINNTYNTITKRNTSYATVGAMSLTLSNPITQIFNDTAQLTFGKSQEQCNITIDIMRVIDDSLISFGLPVAPNVNSSFFTYTCTWTNNTNTITTVENASTITGFYLIPDATNNFPNGTIVQANGTNSYTVSKKANNTQATASPISFYSTLPHFIFIFDIYGIPKDKKNLNNTRI